ncbi:MAG: tRNA (adenosine(37)-N6)-dimethylallyltransferase MiaA [Pirellulales bacterium]
MDDALRDAWFLCGPTASGKTDVSLALSRRLNAEILSLDSMAVFRGMDIGTAKPMPAERTAIPHHLLDIRDPHEEFSVVEYRTLALATVAQLTARGKRALFVGGTPLYLKAMLRGLFDGPPADWAFRAELAEEAARHGVETLAHDCTTSIRLRPPGFYPVISVASFARWKSSNKRATR